MAASKPRPPDPVWTRFDATSLAELRTLWLAARELVDELHGSELDADDVVERRETIGLVDAGLDVLGLVMVRLETLRPGVLAAWGQSLLKIDVFEFAESFAGPPLKSKPADRVRLSVRPRRTSGARRLVADILGA